MDMEQSKTRLKLFAFRRSVSLYYRLSQLESDYTVVMWDMNLNFCFSQFNRSRLKGHFLEATHLVGVSCRWDVSACFLRGANQMVFCRPFHLFQCQCYASYVIREWRASVLTTYASQDRCNLTERSCSDLAAKFTARMLILWRFNAFSKPPRTQRN